MNKLAGTRNSAKEQCCLYHQLPRVVRRLRGQSLMEFALVLPLILLIVMGILDLGWAVYARNTISNAAREGARTGIIYSASDAQICADVQASAAGLGLTCSQISIDPSPARTFGKPITITVAYTYTARTPIIGQFVTGNGLALTASSSMLVEGVTSPFPSQTPGPTNTPPPTNAPTNTPVPDFVISASPTSLAFKQTDSGSVVVTLNSIGSFSSATILSISGLPAGVSASFSPNSVTPTPGGTTSTLTISTLSTPKGTFTLTISATGGGKTHSAIVTLKVN